jgi:hypothetical protein
LQDILRKIHRAYYELYDDNQENGEEIKAVPDMKIVLPYVRRKTLKEVHVVFSGVEHPGVYTQVAYFLDWIADTWV